MDDEDMIATIDTEADHRTQNPVIRERLWPHRVHFKTGRLHRLPHIGAQRCLPKAKCDYRHPQQTPSDSCSRPCHASLQIVACPRVLCGGR